MQETFSLWNTDLYVVVKLHRICIPLQWTPSLFADVVYQTGSTVQHYIGLQGHYTATVLCSITQ